MKWQWLAVGLIRCGGAGQPGSAEVALPSSPGAPTYAIHMHRADHVGDKVHLLADALEDKRTTMFHELDRIGEQHDVKRTHLDAVATVVATGAKDEATHIRYDVKTLGVDSKEIYRGKLDVTRALKEDDAIVDDERGRATTEVRDALRAVVSLRAGGPTDDDIFGTKEPQRVGGRWPIDNRLAQEDLVGDTRVIASVAGDVTLAGVRTAFGVPCLDLRSSLELTGFELPNLPAGTSVESGVMNAELSLLLPIDEKAQRLSDHLSFHMKMKLLITGNPGVTTTTVDVTSKKDSFYTPF